MNFVIENMLQTSVMQKSYIKLVLAIILDQFYYFIRGKNGLMKLLCACTNLCPSEIREKFSKVCLRDYRLRPFMLYHYVLRTDSTTNSRHIIDIKLETD
jgi:hypothetical protein